MDRGHYPNFGPKIPKNVDKRDGTSHFMEYNGKEEKIQLLALSTEGLYPPLTADQVGFNWAADGAKIVSPEDAEKRKSGFEKNTVIVDERIDKSHGRSLMVVWSKIYYIRHVHAADENDPNNTKYPATDEIIPRTALDIHARYDGTINPRKVWLPPGVRKQTLKGSGPLTNLKAIGCTCRNMVFRGATFARYGCKHIHAFNRLQSLGKITYVSTQ